jgi:hypothetical protein
MSRVQPETPTSRRIWQVSLDIAVVCLLVASVPSTIFLPLAALSTTSPIEIIAATGMYLAIVVAYFRGGVAVVTIASGVLFWSRWLLYPDWPLSGYSAFVAAIPILLTLLALRNRERPHDAENARG